jgi:hypothetical protein
MRETIISRNAINCNAQCWHMNKNFVAKECSWNDALKQRRRKQADIPLWLWLMFFLSKL